MSSENKTFMLQSLSKIMEYENKCNAKFLKDIILIAFMSVRPLTFEYLKEYGEYKNNLEKLGFSIDRGKCVLQGNVDEQMLCFMLREFFNIMDNNMSNKVIFNSSSISQEEFNSGFWYNLLANNTGSVNFTSTSLAGSVNFTSTSLEPIIEAPEHIRNNNNNNKGNFGSNSTNFDTSSSAQESLRLENLNSIECAEFLENALGLIDPPQDSLCYIEHEEFFSCIPIENDNDRNGDSGFGKDNDFSTGTDENIGNNEKTPIPFDDERDQIDPLKLDMKPFTCKNCQERNYGGFKCAKCNEENEERKKVLKPVYDSINIPKDESSFKRRLSGFRHFIEDSFS